MNRERRSTQHDPGSTPAIDDGASAGRRTLAGQTPIFRSATAAATTAAPDEAFAKATSGPSAEVPHRAAMEQSFGLDFSRIHAHVGDPAATQGLAQLGARGAARGDEVAFDSASPSQHLVAHELAHVAQADAGGTQATHSSDGVSHPGDAAEVEADAVADRMVAGQTVEVGSAAGGLHKKDVPRPFPRYRVATAAEVLDSGSWKPTGATVPVGESVEVSWTGEGAASAYVYANPHGFVRLAHLTPEGGARPGTERGGGERGGGNDPLRQLEATFLQGIAPGLHVLTELYQAGKATFDMFALAFSKVLGKPLDEIHHLVQVDERSLAQLKAQVNPQLNHGSQGYKLLEKLIAESTTSADLVKKIGEHWVYDFDAAPTGLGGQTARACSGGVDSSWFADYKGNKVPGGDGVWAGICKDYSLIVAAGMNEFRRAKGAQAHIVGNPIDLGFPATVGNGGHAQTFWVEQDPAAVAGAAPYSLKACDTRHKSQVRSYPVNSDLGNLHAQLAVNNAAMELRSDQYTSYTGLDNTRNIYDHIAVAALNNAVLLERLGLQQIARQGQ